MADVMKRQFNALELSGKNFLEWSVDAQINLKAQGLEHAIAKDDSSKDAGTSTIVIPKIATKQEKARVVVFLRHHLTDSLKSEYLKVDDPKRLWENLHDRFGHHKAVLLPKAQYEWAGLRFQDFKSVSEYNSAMFKIVTVLQYCDNPISDEVMIEKTLSTFHANDIVLSQQYRNKELKKYSELISLLLVAEQNNYLLLKNHNLRPTGSKAQNEANAMERTQPSEANFVQRGGHGKFNYRGRGRGNYRGRGRGRGRHHFSPINSNFKHSDKQKGKEVVNHKFTLSKGRDICNRCGMNGHWVRTCCTSKHFADLYQASLKGKGKKAEANFIAGTSTSMPSLDVSDIFMDDIDTDNDFTFNGNNNNNNI